MNFIEKFKEYINGLSKEQRAEAQRELRRALTFSDKPALPNEVIMNIIGEEETLRRIDKYLGLDIITLALAEEFTPTNTTMLTKVTFTP